MFHHRVHHTQRRISLLCLHSSDQGQQDGHLRLTGNGKFDLHGGRGEPAQWDVEVLNSSTGQVRLRSVAHAGKKWCLGEEAHHLVVCLSEHSPEAAFRVRQISHQAAADCVSSCRDSDPHVDPGEVR